MARRSLKPQLNQIRTWVHQGRTNAWIAHQLEVSVRDIDAFKREHELVPAEQLDSPTDDPFSPRIEEEPDLRAEDDALVAAALDAEPEEPADEESSGDGDGGGEGGGGGRRRGRRKAASAPRAAGRSRSQGRRPGGSQAARGHLRPRRRG